MAFKFSVQDKTEVGFAADFHIVAGSRVVFNRVAGKSDRGSDYDFVRIDFSHSDGSTVPGIAIDDELLESDFGISRAEIPARGELAEGKQFAAEVESDLLVRCRTGAPRNFAASFTYVSHSEVS